MRQQKIAAQERSTEEGKVGGDVLAHGEHHEALGCEDARMA